jgi:hypothetical protein
LRYGPRIAVLLLAALLPLLALPALAHPYHASLAEAEFNPETGRLEVALKVLIVDLERALSVDSGAVEHPETDATITRYLARRFRLQCPGAEPATLSWVGKEPELRSAWLYFELSPSGEDAKPRNSLAGCSLEVQIFLELEATQLNTVRLKTPDYETTATLSRDQPELSIPAPAD